MTNAQAREPKGIPGGGQFAPAIRTEGCLALLPPHESIPDLLDVTPETRQVLDALRAAGGRPLIVGGAVRDGLLSRAQGEVIAPKDIDIEVYGLSRDDVRAALPGDVEEFDQALGVFNTIINGQDFDVALPRRDNKTGEGHRGFVVETDPNMDFETAFARRDFTMNSMGVDEATGELIDPHGGRADLEAGVLRHTSDKFTEDPLRILRGVQLAGRFNSNWRRKRPNCAKRCADVHAAEQVWSLGPVP